MANTYTQIYIQFVFTVKGRQNLIHEENREKLEKYICGIISNNKSKAIAVYCNPDHTHVLLGLHPSISISDMAKVIKTNTSKWINTNKWIAQPFRWQVGFGAFSYNQSHLDNVVRYILNQKEHHRKKSFKDEYIQFLEKFEVDYNEKYLFDWIEE